MAKHTITIEIDVPDEMLAAVHDMAHNAIHLLQEDTLRTLQKDNRAINYLKSVETLEVGELIEGLEVRRKATSDALAVVRTALSEITHTMNEANSEWLREGGA